MAYSKTIRVFLEEVILNHPSLFKRKATMEGGPEKFRSNFTMDPTTKQGKKNIAKVEDAIEQALDDLFGGKKVKLKEDRTCLFDGNDFQNNDGDIIDGYADMMYVKATNAKRPKVLDDDGETPITEDDDKIFGGNIVNAYVDIYATDDKKIGGNGVFATLMGVQFVEEGHRFGGNAGLGDDAFKAVGKRGRDEDEDDRPRKKKRARDDDDEDDRPAKKKRPARDEDEDDEDERPAKKKRPSRDDDEDEDDRPRKKKRPRDEDDEDDERI